jgi:hypothetical protein
MLVEIKDKIHFKNNNFDQLNSVSISSKITQNIEEIFSHLKTNNTDKMYLYFLTELKSYVLTYINGYRQALSRKEYKKKINLKNFCSEENLFNNKYLVGKLDPEILNKILDICNKKITFLKTNAASKKLSRKDLTVSGGIIVIRLIKILNKQFKKSGYLEMISNYLQQETEISGVGLELSSEHSTWWRHQDTSRPAPRTLYMHIDNELKNMKAIVYLSEVTKENGPLTLYPGIYENLKINILQNIIGRVVSNFMKTKNNLLKNYYNFDTIWPLQNSKFKDHFKKLPEELRFNSHFGWDINNGSQKEKDALLVEKKMTGDPGLFILFDGSRLVHSGGLVEKNHRIALQIIFAKKLNFGEFLLRKFRNLVKKIKFNKQNTK